MGRGMVPTSGYVSSFRSISSALCTGMRTQRRPSLTIGITPSAQSSWRNRLEILMRAANCSYVS